MHFVQKRKIVWAVFRNWLQKCAQSFEKNFYCSSKVGPIGGESQTLMLCKVLGIELIWNVSWRVLHYYDKVCVETISLVFNLATQTKYSMSFFENFWVLGKKEPNFVGCLAVSKNIPKFSFLPVCWWTFWVSSVSEGTIYI